MARSIHQMGKRCSASGTEALAKLARNIQQMGKKHSRNGSEKFTKWARNIHQIGKKYSQSRQAALTKWTKSCHQEEWASIQWLTTSCTCTSSSYHLGLIFSREFIKHTLASLTLSQVLTTIQKKSWENIVGKGEIAGNQHSSLATTMFSLFREKTKFQDTFILLFADAFCLNDFNTFPNKPWFLRSSIQVLLKHWGKRRNCS